MTKLGYLTIQKDKLIFVAKDKKFDKMLVRDIKQEVYDQIKIDENS